MKSNIENHIKVLVQLSLVDNKFNDLELNFVQRIGKANGLTEEKIDELINDVLLKKKVHTNINYKKMMTSERFDYLFEIIQLMKLDGKVYLSEIKYCELVAEKLGYDKKIVKKLSSKIFKSESITLNREVLMKEAEKYLKI